MKESPLVWSIAGNDPSCGAGSYLWWVGWLYRSGSSTKYAEYNSCGTLKPYAEEDPIGTAERPTP